MTDEAPPLGDALRLIVEPEPDPQYGPVDEKLRDWLEVAVYERLLRTIPAGFDVVSMIDAIAAENKDRIQQGGQLDFEMVANSVLKRGLDPTGCAVFGFRWRLVPRVPGDPTLAVESAASRGRKNRWLAI
jgi:hypothetical protein